MNNKMMIWALLLGGLFLLSRNNRGLASAPGVQTAEFWASPAGAERQAYDLDIGI